MSGKNIVYFDLETQRSISDVGGYANKDKLCISVAVTYSTITKTFLGEPAHQDPFDEPACALLERITDTKEVIPAKTKPKTWRVAKR